MTNSEIFTILRPHIMTVTGVSECILADPNGMSPDGSYASLRPRQSIRERGQANIRLIDMTDNKVRHDIRAQVVCDVVLDFFRDGAMEYAEKLKQCFKRPDVVWPLWSSGIGVRGIGDVQNLTALQASNFEERANVTMQLYYETSNIVDINNILSASFSVENESGDVLQTTDISW